MESASDLLSRQGSVASRLTSGGVRVYSVRYVAEEGGRRKQRAIYLGSDARLVRRARLLISRYRERERATREVADTSRFVAGCGAFLGRMARFPASHTQCSE